MLEKIGDRPGLVRQNVPQDRRVSYFCDPEAVTDDLAPLVAEIGCDLLYSASHYLDVLPGGINKGYTVTKLVEHLGIPKDRVLVAGDTLNDLSMYDIGFPGVCVGEAEDLLLDATRDKDVRSTPPPPAPAGSCRRSGTSTCSTTSTSTTRRTTPTTRGSPTSSWSTTGSPMTR